MEAEEHEKQRRRRERRQITTMLDRFRTQIGRALFPSPEVIPSTSHLEVEFARYTQMGDHHPPRHDLKLHDTWKDGGRRIMSALIVLNDDSNGGEGMGDNGNSTDI